MKRFARFAVAVVMIGFTGAAWADAFKVDPVHSSVNFRSKHVNIGYVYGRFNEFSGTFSLDNADPAKSSFNIEVKADSVDTHQPQRNEHLKSPDFLNAKQ